MNLHNPMNPEDRLSAYSDDTLDEAQRAAFEQDLKMHPDLKHDVEAQKQIDTSLKRCCAAPDIDALLERARRKQGHATGHGDRLRQIGRLAAMVVIGAAAVLAVKWVMTPSRPAYQGTSYVVLGLEPAYQQLVDDGFAPQWRCETDEEFAQTFGDRLGQPLVLDNLPTTVAALGLSYVPAVSSDTIALLATVNEQPVIVFVDHTRAVDGQPPSLIGSGLNLFERRIGDLVLYEVTHLESPALLSRFMQLSPSDEVHPREDLPSRLP